MTKADLVRVTAEASGRDQTMCCAIAEQFFKIVGELLYDDAVIEIRGWGTFYSKERKPRPARNPHNGDVHLLPKRRVALLRFSPDVWKAINAYLSMTEQERLEHAEIFGEGV